MNTKYKVEITKDMKEQANSVDLAEFLITQKSEDIKKESKGYYRHNTHSSLVFRDNKFFWNSRASDFKTCYPIDYLMYAYGKTYMDAVKELLEYQGIEFPDCEATYRVDKQQALKSKIEHKTAENFTLPKLGKDMKRAYSYLIKTRKIDAKIVSYCAEQALITQDYMGNVLFLWKEENGLIDGAEHKVSFSKVPDGMLKSWISKGSNGSNGFNITLGKTIEKMFFFESAVDLLSFMTLKKRNTEGRELLKNSLLVSTGGTKDGVVKEFMMRYDAFENDIDIYLCFDNDDAGRELTNKIVNNLVFFDIKVIYPPELKDWNEYLQAEANGK